MSEVANLFCVDAIMGSLSKLPDTSLVKEAISAPKLVDDVSSGLDHEDPKDRKVSQEKVDWIIKEMTEALNKHSGQKFVCESYWLHVHEKNMSTNTHSHLPSEWSSACYLNVPENSGKICFMVEELGMMASITPELGNYIIFPSRLKHYVTAHGSDEPRVSLSANWKLA